MAARPPVRIALNVAIDGALAALAVPLARAIADPSGDWLHPPWLAGGRCGDIAAGRTAVPAAVAILALCRDRRSARGGVVQRASAPPCSPSCSR